MFILKKNSYYTGKDCKYFGVDVNDLELFDDDYGNYDYDHDYDDDYYDNDYDMIVYITKKYLVLINNNDSDTKPLLSAK